MTSSPQVPLAHRAGGTRVGWLALSALALLWLAPGPATAAEPTDPSEPAVTAPALKTGGWIAKPLQPTLLRAKLGKGRVILRVTQGLLRSTAPPAWMVVDSQIDDSGLEWLRVQVASRPNERTAWVSTADVRLEQTPLFVRIALGSRAVKVYSSGRLIRTIRAVVGAAKTPTPRGLFAIDSVVKQTHPRDFIGPWALHLTAHSTVLENFGGGPGRVAIHGRDGASFSDPLGTARSHGCVRVNNRDVRWLSQTLPPGTPVEVKR